MNEHDSASPTTLVKSDPAGQLATTRPQPIDIEAVLRLVAEKGDAAVATLERVMVIRRELKAEAAEEAYTASMAAFQAECPVIGKPKSVNNRDGSHRYNFAPIEHIVRETQELRERHGFSYEWDSTTNQAMVKAICIITHRDGHKKTFNFESPIDAAPGMNRMQAHASALSFAQRYAFKGGFGIVTGDEDDDANSTHEDKSALAKLKRMKAMRETPPIESAPIVHAGPEEGDPERGPEVTSVPSNIDKGLTDFLLIVSETTDPDDLTKRANETNSFDGPAKATARRAVMDRGKSLDFRWSDNMKSFVKR